jgi:hypothetical protein
MFGGRSRDRDRDRLQRLRLQLRLAEDEIADLRVEVARLRGHEHPELAGVRYFADLARRGARFD